jgi:hypothetical protein
VRSQRAHETSQNVEYVVQSRRLSSGDIGGDQMMLALQPWDAVTSQPKFISSRRDQSNCGDRSISAHREQKRMTNFPD